jgi:hypothetical protein
VSSNIFSTATATLSGDSSSASVTYKWFYSTDGASSWTDITGSNTSTLATTTLQSLGGLVTNTIIKREVYASIGGVECDPESVLITLDVSPPLIVPSITSPATTCSSDPIRFTVGNAAGDTYQWTLNGSVVATGNNYDIAAGSLAAGTYILGVYGESGSCSSTLVTQTLTITDPSTLTINTGLTGDVLCEGESFTITVNDTQSSNTTYTLTSSAGTQTKNSSTGQVTFTLSLVSESDLTVTSTPASGCGSTVTKTVYVPKISNAGTISTTSTLSVCYGESLTDMIYGDGTLSTTTPTLYANSSSASITYQWQYSVASAPTTWINISGAVSSSLVTSTVQSLSILENTSIRRLSYAQIGSVKCEISNATYPKIDIVVENVDGGSITPNLLYTCDVVGSTYTILVDDNSFGNISYQWQSATNNVSSSFVDLSGEVGPSLIVSTNVTETTYYRRITRTDTTSSSCTTAYSNVFEFVSNSINPGTLSDFSGLYCEGSTPPVLGQSSVVTSTYPITYQWYKGEVDDLGNVASSTWQAIPSTNSNVYTPPALSSSFRYVLYRRGVIENRGGSPTCEKYTDYVSFELFDALDIGYIEPASGTPDFPYCVGDRFPNLRLISADPNITDNTNYPNLTASWEMSTDGVSWSTVTDIDSNETTFNRYIGDSNNPSDVFYLADDLYFRVKIENINSSVSTYTLDSYSVKLIENSAPHELGDAYKITIGSSSVGVVVSSVVSTTDAIGSNLASKINTDITGYTASYLPDGNIIQIFDNASNAYEISTSVSYTLNQTLQLNLLQAFNNSTTKNCTYYTSVYKIDVVDRPTIDIDGGAAGQEVCDGTSITPIPISWTGSSSILIIGLDPGLSVNVGSGTEQTIGGNKLISGTDSITITGTPNSDNTFNVRINSYCRDDSQLNVQYRITKVPSPPDICFLIRDIMDYEEKTIFYDGDGRGYFNTIL